MTGANSRGAGALEWLHETLPEDVPAPLIDLAVAAAVVVVGWYVAGLVVQIAGRPVARRFKRPSITRTVLQGIRAGVLVVAFVIAAGVMGVDSGDILISGAVLAAVIGVILAPIVGSFISGLFVLADQPYEIGDMIELVDEETRGYVEDITLRYTKMFTLDNTFIVIPNSTIRERDIVNYSAEDERTRQTIDLVVTYEGELAQARRLAERAARNVDGVIAGGPAIRIGSTRYPAAPTAYITEFGDHGVHLALRFWAETPYRLQTIRSAVQENVWAAIEDADVEIAYPHSHLVFDESSGQVPVVVRDDDGRDGRRPGQGGPGDAEPAGDPTSDDTTGPEPRDPPDDR